MDNDTGFTISVETESMPDMRSNRSGKSKKKPKLVNASFQAGAETANTAAAANTEEFKSTTLVDTSGFNYQMHVAQDSHNHFESLRKKDKIAYDTEIESKFGFEQAQPKTEEQK